MWLVNGIVAGILAGVAMILVSEICYRLGILKSHLIIIDGSFALRLLKRRYTIFTVYLLGTLIHLVTSAVFGAVYAILARVFNFDARLIFAVAPYVIFLWLAMLYLALPVAGQGFIGKRIGRSVWAEQLFLHVIFGLVFWWALGIGL